MEVSEDLRTKDAILKRFTRQKLSTISSVGHPGDLVELNRWLQKFHKTRIYGTRCSSTGHIAEGQSSRVCVKDSPGSNTLRGTKVVWEHVRQ